MGRLLPVEEGGWYISFIAGALCLFYISPIYPNIFDVASIFKYSLVMPKRAPTPADLTFRLWAGLCVAP